MPIAHVCCCGGDVANCLMIDNVVVNDTCELGHGYIHFLLNNASELGRNHVHFLQCVCDDDDVNDTSELGRDQRPLLTMCLQV